MDSIDNSILNNSRLLAVELSSKISSINSNNCSQLVKYFDDFRIQNYPSIRRIKSTSKLGWNGVQFITPYTNGTYVFDGSSNMFSQSLRLKGNLTDWTSITSIVFQSSYIPRFIVSAGFASVLLKPLNSRPFTIYLWGTSTFGKSALYQLVASIWGMSEMILSFGSTLNGMIGSAVERDGFPFIIDDKQQRRNTLDINRLIMTINNGKSDTKMNKHSNIQNLKQFNVIGMFNGEEPLIEDNATNGVHTRTISLQLTSDLCFDKSIIWNSIKDQNCGHAGKLFVETISHMDVSDLIQRKNAIFTQLRQQFPNHHEEHVNYVALVALTEELVCEYILHIPSQSNAMAVCILDSLQTKQELSNSEKFWEHLISWIAAENLHFKRPCVTPLSPCYGEYKDSCLYITKAALEMEFKRWGNFSIQKVIDDLYSQGFLETYTEGTGKLRKLWKVSINGIKRVPAIKISADFPQGNGRG